MLRLQNSVQNTVSHTYIQSVIFNLSRAVTLTDFQFNSEKMFTVL